MGILSGDSQADMRSFYYSSSRTSTLTREEDDNMTGVDDNINAINSIELFSTTMTTTAVSVPAVIVPMATIVLSYWRPAKEGNHQSNGISIDAKKNRRMHCPVGHRIHEG